MTDTTEKPLFVPLKSQYYYEFKNGTKTRELRRGSDKRWSAKNCRVGRAATLSRGYGKQDRLSATVSAHKVWRVRGLSPRDYAAFVDCYGHGEEFANVIEFENIRPQS